MSTAHAAEWFKTNLEEVAKEFAQVGFGGKRFEADGGDEFVSFATGRRAVESLTIRLYTLPIHDGLIGLYTFGRGLLDPGFESGANKVVRLSLSVYITHVSQLTVYVYCTHVYRFSTSSFELLLELPTVNSSSPSSSAPISPPSEPLVGIYELSRTSWSSLESFPTI